MSYCHVDIETFSEANLKVVGTHNYANHPSTKVLCFMYSFRIDGVRGPVHMWVPWVDEAMLEAVGGPEAITPVEELEEGACVHWGAACPEDLHEWASSGNEFRAWNAQFERTVLNARAKPASFPHTQLEQWVCTMAKAAAHSLPQALGHCAKECGTSAKDEDGRQVMLQLSRPRKPSKKDPDTEWLLHKYPNKYRKIFGYCVGDVLAEASLDEYIPDLPKIELQTYFLDQRINDRGIKIDRAAVESAQTFLRTYKNLLAKRCIEITGVKPTQTAKLSEWINERYPMPDLQAATVREALADKSMPKEVRQVLRIYSTHNMKAVSKYKKMLEVASPEDDFLRGMFVYHAASTGRWSSRVVQLQNLFRPVIKDPENAIPLFKYNDVQLLKAFYAEDPMLVLASCVRGMLIADTGCDLLARDYSQIEARIIAWLAGQDDILEVFASGKDVYVHVASKIYGKPQEDITSDERFVGKISVLSLGYQGGWRAFAKMAKQYGVEIDMEFAEKIKTDWRKANKRIVKLWYKMEEMARAAVANPGAVYAVDIGHAKIQFGVRGNFLYMRLPSGRRLAYHKPQLDSEGMVSFIGIDTYTRRRMRISTYGGMLTENAVQAIARDLLRGAMFRLEDASYPIHGTVHDEVITQPQEGFGSEEEVDEIMCDVDPWAAGLPVNSTGFRTKRYRK
jgi:DNA polymerase